MAGAPRATCRPCTRERTGLAGGRVLPETGTSWGRHCSTGTRLLRTCRTHLEQVANSRSLQAQQPAGEASGRARARWPPRNPAAVIAGETRAGGGGCRGACPRASTRARLVRRRAAAALGSRGGMGDRSSVRARPGERSGKSTAAAYLSRVSTAPPLSATSLSCGPSLFAHPPDPTSHPPRQAPRGAPAPLPRLCCVRSQGVSPGGGEGGGGVPPTGTWVGLPKKRAGAS